MSGKHNFLISFIILFSIAAISSGVATTLTWDNEAGDGNWNTPTNWSTNIVPPATSAYYAKIGMAAGPTLSTGQTANAYRVYVEGTGGSNGTLIMNGGTLNTGNWIGIGYTASTTGTLTISGDSTITASGISGHIYCGSSGTATLNMSGGTVTLSGTFFIAQGTAGTSIGTVNISGGTITCNALSINTNPGNVGTINLSGGTITCNTNPPTIYANGGTVINLSSSGKLVIAGDATALITACVGDGRIKAYGGAGTVMKDFNVTTLGKTTVWGTISDKATIPKPANSATNVAVSGTNLGWRPGSDAVSHDIYFGTVSNDVNNAQRLAGDLDGDGIVDWLDMAKLTEYWLLDPIGSDPYAGVNDDNTVDFFDYAMLAQGWKDTAAPIFKGNQDSNSFNPGTLAFGTTYYWRIDEANGPNTVKGDLWSFATQTGKASILAPANEATNVLSRAVLVWTAGIGAASHDVYFDTANPPETLVSDNQTGTIYNPGGTIANSTTYYWRIDENYGATTIQGDVWSFTTIDEANEPDIVFVQATDPQMGWTLNGVEDPKWGITITKVNNLNPDFMLVTGDLVNTSTSDPQVAEYKSYKSALNPAIECYEVPGNHDLGEPPDQAKYDAWATNYGYGTAPGAVPWYTFTFGNSLFIGLDTVVLCDSSAMPGKDVEEMNWLTATLVDANTAGYDHIFVFMHYGFTGDKWAFAPARAAELKALLQEYNVKAVFDGHTHYDAYAMYGTLEDFTTRSCTANLGAGPPPPGIRIIKVYSDRIEQEVRELTTLP